MYYWDQGGWARTTWGAVDRTCFVFSDSLQAGGSLQAIDAEGAIDKAFTLAEMAEIVPNHSFAGIVCVAN